MIPWVIEMTKLLKTHWAKLVLCWGNVTHQELITFLTAKDFRYYRQPCPQQENTADCGIHVLYNTRVLISRMLYPNLRPNQPWDLSNINPDTAKNRRELRNLYESRSSSNDASDLEPDS